jgi:hypothetical protein
VSKGAAGFSCRAFLLPTRAIRLTGTHANLARPDSWSQTGGFYLRLAEKEPKSGPFSRQVRQFRLMAYVSGAKKFHLPRALK